MGLTFIEISLRLLIATFFGSIIGWERERRSRPAGLRTHILVCVGATIIAMIQKQIMSYFLSGPFWYYSFRSCTSYLPSNQRYWIYWRRYDCEK